MNWISVKDALPEIPKGKYGVQVLTAQYDPVYAELCGDKRKGYSVHQTNYAFVDYNCMPMFKGSIFKDGEPAFMEIYFNKIESSWGPTGDEVTHWMYLPEPPMEIPEL